MTYRVRFAPSPTGYLHIGGVRTALYNWLLAKRHGGKFLLRIEDTDKERSDEKFTKDILSSLSWFGMAHDDDIMYQSQNLPLHQKHVDALLQAGQAYVCTCSPDEVEAMREKAKKSGARPQYDRSCREKGLKPGGDAPFVIRAKIPLTGEVKFNDLIRGEVAVPNTEVDDFVLVRTDGSPTYNFVVVIDDDLMKISHVIRGEEHLSNTPKQIHVARFLGLSQPTFAHLPIILGTDKKKLSKRHGSFAVGQYREQGYLPQALLNFLVRLGWSHGDQEVFRVEEMIKEFSFDHVQKSGAIYDAEKLQWLNGVHIRESNAKDLSAQILELGSHSDELAALLKSDLGVKLVELAKPKAKLLTDFLPQLAPFCENSKIEIDESRLKWTKKPELKPLVLKAIQEAVAELDAKLAASGLSDKKALGDAGMSHEAIFEYFKGLAKKHGLKPGDLMPVLRMFVGGVQLTLGLTEAFEILPWQMLRERLMAPALA